MPFEGVPRIFGLVYALAVILVVFLLFRSRRLHMSYRISLLLLTVLSGFLLFAPMTPIAFEVFILHLRSSPFPLLVTAAGLLLFIGITLLAGRIFCGYCCPIGAVQELAYFAPGPKILLRSHPILLIVRGILITVCIGLAFFASLNLLFSSLLVLRGARDTFIGGGFTIFIFIFASIIVLSAFLYRPFCRFACPYGALCSLAAAVSLFRMRKGPGCTACEHCEEACPTGEAGPRHRGCECYLCCRCVDACAAQGTMSYRRR